MRRLGVLFAALVSIGLLAAISYSIVDRGMTDSIALLARHDAIRLATSKTIREVLVQDEATQSMLLDPKQISIVSPTKIAAYDHQQLLMSELEHLSREEEVAKLVRELRALEQHALQPLEEQLLEDMASGHQESARDDYLAQYVPMRAQYTQLMGRLESAAHRQAANGEAALAEQTKLTLDLLLSVFGGIALLVCVLYVLERRRRFAVKTSTRLERLVEITSQLLKTHSALALVQTLRALLPEAKTVELVPGDAPQTPLWGLESAVLPLVVGEQRVGRLELQVRTSRADRDFWSSLATTVAQHVVTIESAERLRASESHTRSVLESLSEGLAVVDLAGRTLALSSRALTAWFGPLPLGAPLGSYLFADPTQQASFALFFDQLVSDTLPFEVAATQMAETFERDGRTFAWAFSAVREGDALSRVIVTIRDVTEETKLRRQTLEARDLLTYLEHARERPEEAAQYLLETRAELERLDDRDLVTLRRRLHTLKGAAAMFEVTSFAQALDEAEDVVAEVGALTAEWRSKLHHQWETFEAKARLLSADQPAGSVMVTRDLVASCVTALERGASADVLSKLKASLLIPLESRLAVLSRQAVMTAARLHKQLEVDVSCALDLRVDGARFGPFLRTLSHVVRNAVDHGLEVPDVRRAHGKSEQGHLALQAERAGDALRLTIADDGAGIDFERVAARARSLGLPTDSRAQLFDALFEDGLSTAQVVSEISGRGIGLAAVKAACTALGGTVSVQADHGTRFTFTIPLQQPRLRLASAPV